MGNDARKAQDNIYFKCRKEAAVFNEKLYSREGAAEMLGVSVSSLADYELGNIKAVPVDKVVLMADLYKAPHLLNMYCATECPIGCRRGFATQIRSLERTTLGLLDIIGSDELEACMKDLTHIAVDGEIDESHQQRMSEIVAFLSRIRVLVEELTLYYEKNRST